MMTQIFFAFWFFLPAGIANMAPVFAAVLPVLKHWSWPLDFHQTWRKKRLLGHHKTIRGFIAGIATGILCIKIEFLLLPHVPTIQSIAPVTYIHAPQVLLGAFLGGGALTGDAIKSFFKRQLAFPPGASWIPFDQLDFVLGGLIASLLIIRLDIRTYVLVACLYVLLHSIISFLRYRLMLKQSS